MKENEAAGIKKYSNKTASVDGRDNSTMSMQYLYTIMVNRKENKHSFVKHKHSRVGHDESNIHVLWEI